MTIKQSKIPIKVLVIDDDEDDFLIISDFISDINEGNFETVWCNGYIKALKEIELKKYDIYFIDYRLGVQTGIDLVKQAIAMQCEEPLILLTGKGNTTIDREAMKFGATDYLIKGDLTAEKMERCIRYSMERTASLKALKASERKYRSVFEKSRDAVFIANENLELLDVNEAMCELLSLDAAQINHQGFLSYFVQKNQADVFGNKLEEDGEVENMEIEILQEEEIRTCVVSASVEFSKDGNYVQGILHDITWIRKAEKATLQAEKLDAAGRLVRTLAHEVRNPLNNIMLANAQLCEEITDDFTKTYTNIIDRNSQRINDLISELLNSSRPGTFDLQLESLHSIIEECIFLADDRVKLFGATIKYEKISEDIMIYADKAKLGIAILNIIINGIEATIGKKGEIYISAVANARQITLFIEDNGTGITSENIDRLFEPYFTSKRNGMGLGLASCLNIIRSHNATIDVSSKLGEGTVFYIRFQTP